MPRSKKKMRHGHYLLFKKESNQKVWVYDFFQWHELKAQLSKGWELERK